MGSPALSVWPPPAWKVQEFLGAHEDLSIVPADDGALHIAGPLRLVAEGPDQSPIELDYRIEIVVPRRFPRELARVRETSGRIQPTFHRLEGGFACLGSPMRLLIHAQKTRTIQAFFDYAILPYFFGHAYWKRFKRMPLGELPHFGAGLVVDYCDLLGARDAVECLRLLEVLGLRRRLANKRPCPCGSGVRLGRCHSARLNGLRGLVPRHEFRKALRQARQGG